MTLNLLTFWFPSIGLVLLTAPLGTPVVSAQQTIQSTEPSERVADKPAGKVLVGGIRVSKETTRITGPIQNNRINYLEHLNQRLSKGVKPASNAAAAYWQAVGTDSQYMKEIDSKDFFRRLGVEPVAGMKWLTFQEVIEQKYGDDRQRWEGALDEQGDATHGPWRRGAHPVVASWLDANEASLKRIVGGLNRPHWYSPMVWTTEDEQERTLVAAAFVNVESPREIARALIARAMQRLGEGKHEAAWQDVFACHQLARHMNQGSCSLIDMLVGIAIDGMACQAEWVMAQQSLPVDLWKRIQKDRATLPDIQSTADVLDHGERYMFLDAVMNIASGKGANSLLGDDALVRRLLSVSIDWNETLRLGNENYDHIVALAKLPTHVERQAAHEKFAEELKGMMKRPSALSLAAMFLAGNADKLVGKQIGKILVALLLPAVHQAKIAEDRIVNLNRMTDVVVSLAIYRGENQNYPDRLEDSGLKSLPRDVFSDQPFAYKRTGNGFLIHDLGPNRRDDGGVGPYNGGQYPEEDDNAIEVKH